MSGFVLATASPGLSRQTALAVCAVRPVSSEPRELRRPRLPACPGCARLSGPQFSRIEPARSCGRRSAGLALRKALAFSRPWPRRWLSYENQAPDFSTTPALTPRSIELADLGDALAVHDVELHLLERRCHLVLHHLHPRLNCRCTSSRSLIAADPPDVEAHRGIELECVAARRRLGRSVHHADLHADLVDEDDHRLSTARSKR